MATADVLTNQQILEHEYDSTVRQDIELFRSQAQAFLSGQLTADEFRPFRLRRGIYGQTLHIDPRRRLVIAINSAAEQATGRAQGQARQDFSAAVKAELDRERR